MLFIKRVLQKILQSWKGIHDPLHEMFKAKSERYKIWHEHPLHPAIHYGVAGTTSSVAALTVKAFLLTVATVTLLSPQVFAATSTWTSQGDWASWNTTNTSSSTNPGSLALSASMDFTIDTDMGGTNSLYSLSGTGPNDIWASTYHYNGSSWTDTADGLSLSGGADGVFAISSNDVWIYLNDYADSSSFAHYNGTTWADTGDLPDEHHMTDMWGSASNDIWATYYNSYTPSEDPKLLHYDGISWNEASVNLSLFNGGDGIRIWGTSSSDIWLSSSLNNKMYHYNGSTWSSSNAPASCVQDVWGLVSTNFYAIGCDNVLYSYNGSSWNSVHSFGSIKTKILGTSSSDIWVYAEEYLGGEIDYFDGSSWTHVNNTSGKSIRSLWRHSASDQLIALAPGGVYGELTTVLELTNGVYSSSGTATKSFDATSASVWNTLTRAQTLNSQTATYYGTDDADGVCPAAGDGTPSTWTGAGWSALSFSSNVATLSESTSRYFCLGVYLATSDTAVTPLVDSLSLDYTILSVTLTAPNSGNTLIFNGTSDTSNITWVTGGASGADHIRLRYSTNSGSSWSDISGATALSTGTTSYAWDMPDVTSSTVRVRAQLEDAGNTVLATSTTSGDFSLVYDTTNPVASITSPTSSTTYRTRNSSVTLAGTASDAVGLASVTTSPSSTVTGTTSWSTSAISLSEGDNAITVTATDLADNIGTDSITVTKDTTAPASPTSGASDPSVTTADLSWTNPVDSDFDGVIVVRKTTGSFTAPTDGSTYTVGNTIGGKTIVYVGSATGFTDTGLTGSTAYQYGVYSYDLTTKNYSSPLSISFTTDAANQNPSSPTSLGPTGLIDGTRSNDTTPTLTFTLSDPDGSDQVKYQIQIDTDYDFSGAKVVDYTSALASQGAASFTVGQALGSGTYTTGTSGQTLSDASWYWRVRTIDASGGTSGWSVANVQ
jgi:hypothetical protein